MSDFVIACDIDEVLFPYLPGWVQFYNRTHDREAVVKVSDFHSYNFSHVLTEHDEAYITTVVYDFHESPEFLEVQPIEGAIEAIKQLQELGDVHFVTSRQLAIAKVTYDWIFRFFGIEQDKIHLGNHWCRDTDAVTAQKTKAEMCGLINARVLIDDSVSYAQECASAGMHAVLFDLNGSYGWNKLQTDSSGAEIQLHECVTRATSWVDTIAVVQNIQSNDHRCK
jgi:5'(3')-deoxyribonucleotidase